MHVKKLLLLLAAVCVVSGLQAQDIHFSQFNMSPMTLNPANIGAFEGTARVGGIYRGQFAKTLGNKNQFSTPTAFVDAPIIRGFRKKDWVGVGLVFFSDKAGLAKLQHSGAKLGASYHLALNKKATTYITLGAQYGKMSRKLNANDLILEHPDEKQTLAMAGDANWTDIDGGISLKSRLNDRMDFSVGYAMYHIARGRYNLLQSGNALEIDRRSVATGQFNIKMNDKFTVSPTFIYQTMGGTHDEIIVQGLGAYLFNAEKEITLLFGLGYRLRDAIHPMLGVQYKTLRVGLAYDLNISNAVPGLRGGFELAANYIIKIYKPSVIKTRVLCPRF